MSIADDIRGSSVLLIIIDYAKYKESILRILQESERVAKRIGYISVKVPYFDILHDLNTNHLNVSKYFFVDTISILSNKPSKADNCIFVTSPTALTEIKVGCKTLFVEKNRDILIFDNISELALYHNTYLLTKFFQSLILDTHSLNRKIIFIAYYQEESGVTKDIKMFTDIVLTI